MEIVQLPRDDTVSLFSVDCTFFLRDVYFPRVLEERYDQ